MTRRTLMLLAATALAVLLAGCDSSQQDDGSSSSQDSSSPQQQFEAANLISAGACTGSGGTDLQQEGRGEVFNGKIAFSRTNADLTSRVYVIDEDGTNETGLTDSVPSASGPVWSPDGEQIAFDGRRDDPYANFNIYVMDADGTNERRLADNPALRVSPAWSPNGEQIAYLRSPAGTTADDIYMIDEDGTNETRLTQFHSDPGTSTHTGRPVWSPDGNKIAFSISSTTTAPSSDSPESTGPSTAPAMDETGIYVIDVDTVAICKLTSIAGPYQVSAGAPAWSPEGNKMAFYDKEAVNVINTDGTQRKELTDTVSDPSDPAWAPDGKRIAFVKQGDLYVINADGSGLRRLANTTLANIGTTEGPAFSPDWSPDGEKLAFSCPSAPEAEGTDLCVMNADGTEWKRIAKLSSVLVGSEGGAVSVSWGRG